MTDTGAAPPPPSGGPAKPTPPVRERWITALMVLTGILLLLPGLCSIFFASGALLSGPSGVPDFSFFVPFLLVTFAIGFGGIMLLRAAIRGPRS